MKLRKIKLKQKLKNSVLALGPQKNNTVCFARGNYAYLSLEHNDLENPRDFLSYRRNLEYFLKKSPRIIAYDLHPEYQSTKYIHYLETNSYHLEPIQHHHAHIAACMAENNLKDQKVIGVAFDGTGMGSDNHIWGGEFLICTYGNFKRAGHLKETYLLGGEKAILEPWRLALIWLYQIYKDKLFHLNLKLVKKIKRHKWQVLKDMYLKGFNSLPTSSAGRLFDAAASLIFSATKATFEAELAIRLENAAKKYKLKTKGYKFRVFKDKENYILDSAPLFKELISDLEKKESVSKIAYRFHLAIAQGIKRMAVILRQKTGISRVVLSGGVFQNNLLLKLTLELLYKEKFRVFYHHTLTSSDASISLGQAVIASARS